MRGSSRLKRALGFRPRPSRSRRRSQRRRLEKSECDLKAADCVTVLLMRRPSCNLSLGARSARELLASNVLSRRVELGWSQEQLAAGSGLHRTFIAHVERQVRNISIDNVERLAVALGASVHELLLPQRLRRSAGQRGGAKS